MLFSEASWPEIEALRAKLTMSPEAQRAPGAPKCVAQAGQLFAHTFNETFSSSVLTRVFIVQPFAALPAADRSFAEAFVRHDARLHDGTRVLSLIGTSGREASWCDRNASGGHLAIPLLDRQFVSGAPMIAKLLADLEVDLQGLDDGRPIATRRMLGGRNGTFYVPDAPQARDAHDRPIIPAQEFVRKYGIRTVFGMGGAYVDGTLALAIIFTTEALDRAVVDRFPSFISTFKMATSTLLASGHVYA